jgi:pentapeptide MXKDX repeat protein
MNLKRAIICFAASGFVVAGSIAAPAFAEDKMKTEEAAPDHMKTESMSKEHMKKTEGMSKDHMKGDAMKGDSMGKEK